MHHHIRLQSRRVLLSLPYEYTATRSNRLSPISSTPFFAAIRLPTLWRQLCLVCDLVWKLTESVAVWSARQIEGLIVGLCYSGSTIHGDLYENNHRSGSRVTKP